jgi:hypothetical protein
MPVFVSDYAEVCAPQQVFQVKNQTALGLRKASYATKKCPKNGEFYANFGRFCEFFCH